MNVSICIPTYNRPGFLAEAIDSCLRQTYKPKEILIGDDSTNNESEELIEKIKKNSSTVIRYFHHMPSLKQVKNVNFLFDSVRGDKLILLHDDDLLLPEALEKMVKILQNDNSIQAVFGKQYIISENGLVNEEATIDVNKYYFREAKFEGNVLTPLQSGISQQFPNDAFLIDSKIARKIKYREFSKDLSIGDACDFDFGFRLGQEGIKMYFINEFTAKYRTTLNSVSSESTTTAYKSYKLLHLYSKKDKSSILSTRLKQKAPIAIIQANSSGNKKDAFNIFFSKWHFNKIFTPGGIKRFLILTLG
jgi:glycosyltransferase involved in cell wall biosynthesis